MAKGFITSLGVSDDVLDCRIPKLTLQPLVENAFVHGLDHKAGEWRLEVAIRREPAAGVLIMIRDNGAGMAPEQLNRLRSQLDQDLEQVWTQGTSIGLINVASRIQMYFGAEYKVDMNSQAGQGTCVTLHFPDQKEG